MPCLLLVKARQTNELGKAEEGKPESSVRQGKGRQRKARGKAGQMRTLLILLNSLGINNLFKTLFKLLLAFHSRK